MKEEYNVKDLATNNIPNEFDNIAEYGPLDHVAPRWRRLWRGGNK